MPSGVWRLEHGDGGVVAVEADGGVGPLATDVEAVVPVDVLHHRGRKGSPNGNVQISSDRLTGIGGGAGQVPAP